MRSVLAAVQAMEPLQAVSRRFQPAGRLMVQSRRAPPLFCYQPNYSTSSSLGRGWLRRYLPGSLANLNYTQSLTAPALCREFLRLFGIRCGDPYAGKYSDKANHQVESDGLADELCGE